MQIGQRLFDQLKEMLGSGSDGERLAAVRALEPSCETAQQADIWLWTLARRLLRANRLLDAAKLFWSEDRFNTEPECVKRIWKAIESSPKVILLGCGSAGKSYSSVTWLLLDWLRDCQYTNSKVISSTAGHAKSNIFSTLHTLHAESRIRLPGLRLDGFVGLDSQNRHAGISRISIPAGASGRAALQGFHPLPRPEPDPIFGKSGRCRAVVDEAEEVPIGLFRGVANMLLSMDRDTIKVVCACNPRDVLSPLASIAQPRQGWTRVRPDEDKDWQSVEEWSVTRIDGIDLENVKHKRIVFPGFMSYPGFENLRLKAGGNSAEYWCFARGMYALDSASNTVIPLSFLDDLVGTYLFTGRVTPCGSVDCAFEGSDETIFCAGRYGQASGWREHPSGKLHYFDKPRYVLQVDQLFPMPKKRTLELAGDIIDQCEKLNIRPQWFLIDRTGPGVGLGDSLASLWDPDCYGLNWAEEATETKILEDDTTLPIEEYEGVVSEMYFALRRWVEHGYLKFSPTLADQNKLFQEMTQRKYSLGTKGPTGLGRIRIQPKKEFKAVFGWSPDRCDSVVMCLHQCRIQGPEKARATASSVRRKSRGNIGIVERARVVPWSEHLDR